MSVTMRPTQAAPGDLPPLLPLPSSLVSSEGRLTIDASMTVRIDGHDDVGLRRGLARALHRWEERTTLTWARAANGEYAVTDQRSATLVLACAGPGPTAPTLGEDESYELTVDSAHAVVRAPTVTGALRGLETLLQLLSTDGRSWFVPAVAIKDAPRFPWRGLLIDPCRHWMPLEVIHRTLDAMAVVKLNVLHFHLSDDQGFRVESKRFPRLQELGSDGLYYTQDELRGLVAYAADRGIRIVPEFDVPGHATSWAVAFPELMSAPGPYAIERRFGIFDPVLDPTNEKVYELLDGFFAEMAAVFPDRYLHIGGDENNGKQWNTNPAIRAFIAAHGLKDNEGLHAYFNQRVRALLEKHGRSVVGWDEILHPDLPRDAVVQSWRGPKGLVAAARAGHAVLLSHGYYLDHGNYAWQYYANDPLPVDSALDADEQRRVVGGEACMWAEWVSPETIDSRIWPSAAAVAERLWSPRDVVSPADLYRRLGAVSQRLSEAGARHLANPPLLLRRLGGERISAGELAAIQAVLEWTEAHGIGGRARLHPEATQYTPLTRVVDCVALESDASRRLAGLVDGFVLARHARDADTALLVASLFQQWQTQARVARQASVRSPGLHDFVVAADTLEEAAGVGLEALQSLATGRPANAEWGKRELGTLTRLQADNSAALRFPFLASVRKLAAAAVVGPDLGGRSSEAWRREVEQVAGDR